MAKYEVRYIEKRRPLDSMPPVVQAFPIVAKDDTEARKTAEILIFHLSNEMKVELVGLREVTYRDVPLK